MSPNVGVDDYFEEAQAAKLFTDREEPREAFWKKVAAYRQDIKNGTVKSIKVLNYYGTGGIGKSELLAVLGRELEDPAKCQTWLGDAGERVKHITYNFEAGTEPVQVLRALRDQLADTYHFQFPLFDLGLYTYAKRAGISFSPDVEKTMSEQSDVWRIALKAAQLVPGVNLVAQIIDATDEGRTLLRKLRAEHSQEMARMEEAADSYELCRLLPALFVRDLSEVLTGRRKLPGKWALAKGGELLVVFLDTYEKLVNELSGMGDVLANDEWIQGKGGLTRTENVLWVIAGRDILKWERFDPTWRSDPPDKEDALESHLLGELSAEDAMGFLEESAVGDEALRRGLYQLTKGAPIYLDICVKTYRELLRKGKTPALEDFGGPKQELVERYVRYMSNTERDMAFFLAILEVWDDKMAYEVARAAQLSAFSSTGYEAFKGLSFINASDPSGKTSQSIYTIDELVGSVLREQAPGALRDRILPAAMEYCAGRAAALQEANVLSPEYSRSLQGVARYAVQLLVGAELAAFYREQIKDGFTSLFERGQFDAAGQILAPLLQATAGRESEEETLFCLEHSRLLRARGSYRESEEQARKALDLDRRLLGEDHFDTISAMHALADACSALGRYQEALELQQTVLEKCKAGFGEDARSTISAMHNLAAIYLKLGRYQEALELQQTILEKRRAKLGEACPDTITAMQNLAATYSKMGRYQEALELRQAVLEKRKAILGEDHPETLSAMNDLAISYSDMGNCQKALELRQAVLEKSKATLGEDHPNTLTAMNNLAISYSDLGRHQEALELRQIVLEKSKATLGEDHPDTLTAMGNLASSYSKLWRHQEALELQQTVMEKSKATLGEDHPATLTAMSSLAIFDSNLGRHQEAFELLQTVLEKRKALLGEDHPATLTDMQNLAFSYLKQERCQEALELQKAALEKCKATQGEDHPDTLTAMQNLALTYSKLGRSQEVLELEEVVFEKRRTILGEDHPATLLAMEGLAVAYSELERYQEALELQKITVEKCKVVRGEDHLETLIAMQNLMAFHSKLGHDREASELEEFLRAKYDAVLGEDDSAPEPD